MKNLLLSLLILALPALAFAGPFGDICGGHPENKYVLSLTTGHQTCVMKGMPYQYSVDDLVQLSKACEYEKVGNYATVLADVENQKNPVLKTTCWMP